MLLQLHQEQQLELWQPGTVKYVYNMPACSTTSSECHSNIHAHVHTHMHTRVCPPQHTCTLALPPGGAYKLICTLHMHTDRVVNLTTVSDFIHNFGQKNNVSSCQVQAFHHRDVSESLNLFINIYLCMYIHEMKYFDHSYSEEFCRLDSPLAGPFMCWRVTLKSNS